MRIGSLNSNDGNGHLKMNIDYFLIMAKVFLACFIVDRACYNWTGRIAVEVNKENERFTVVCSHCR